MVARVVATGTWDEDEYSPSMYLQMRALQDRIRRLEALLDPSPVIGLKGWNFSPEQCVNPGLLSTPRLAVGTVYAMKLAIFDVTTISSIMVSVVAAGSTNGAVATINTVAGVELGRTNDISALLNSNGNKTLPLISTTSVLDMDYVYVAILVTSVVLLGSGPCLGQTAATSITSNTNLAPNVARFATWTAGSIANPLPTGSFTGSPMAMWAGVL